MKSSFLEAVVIKWSRTLDWPAESVIFVHHFWFFFLPRKIPLKILQLPKLKKIIKNINQLLLPWQGRLLVTRQSLYNSCYLLYFDSAHHTFHLLFLRRQLDLCCDSVVLRNDCQKQIYNIWEAVEIYRIL